MPSWKKIITSGSSTAFHHITASGNISTSCEATMSTGLLDLCGPLQIGPSGIVRDPAGNDTITLGTNTVGLTALTVGGGFGSTGVTVTSAGAISANGALTCSVGNFPVIAVTGQGGVAISLGNGANFISDEGILTSRRADSDAADTDIKSTKFTKADETEAGFFAFNEQELKVKEHHLLSDMDKDLAVKKQYRIQIGGSADANEVADFQEKRVKISVPLTASSDISASGKIIAADAQFGLGTVIIDGANITMSGQLSSSGTGTNILGGDLDFDGDRTIGTVGANDDITINPEAKLILGSSGTDVVEIGRQSGTSAAGRTEIYANTSTVAAKFSLSQITFNHPVTGSNISASGDLYGTNLYGADGVFHDNDANTGIEFGSDTITIKENNVQSAKFATSAGNSVGNASYRMSLTGSQILLNSAQVVAQGPITASGTISASSFIQTTEIKGGGSGDTQLNVQGQITASKNISSSADIIANRFLGTLATAAQTNITSLGTLATLTVSGKGTFGDLAIETTGTNAILELERASGAELKLKAQDNQSRITYEGGPLMFDRDESGTNSLTIGVGGHITASGNISASGAISGPAGFRIFSKTGTTDGEGQGDIVYFGGTTSMTAGDIYHFKSDGTWELANCNAAATSDGLLGVALGASSDVDGVLLRGTVTLHTIDGSESVGDVLYLSEDNTGHANMAPPGGNGDIVRVIGYCLDASNGQIWFDPDKTFVEVTA